MMTKNILIYPLILLITSFFTLDLRSQNSIANPIIAIEKVKGGFEFMCNKHLNILPNTQDIVCKITFKKQGEKVSKTIFDNRIGLSNFSFTEKTKGIYTVVFKNGKCQASYIFDYKGIIPKIKEVINCP